MARKLRLGVGSPSALHSNVWTVWTQGDELYAAARAAHGTMKLSVHSSGVCRYALVKNPDVPIGEESDPRVFARWRIAPVGKDPWTPVLQLVVPGVFVPRRFSLSNMPPARQASVRWLDPAAWGNARVVLMIRARTAEQDISEHIVGDFDVLETLDLRSGGVVWVVAYEVTTPEKDARECQKFTGDWKVTFDGDRQGDPDMMISYSWGNHHHPYPAITDVALGWANIVASAPPQS